MRDLLFLDVGFADFASLGMQEQTEFLGTSRLSGTAFASHLSSRTAGPTHISPVTRTVGARHGTSSCATAHCAPYFPVQTPMQRSSCEVVSCVGQLRRGACQWRSRPASQSSGLVGAQEPNGCWLPSQASSPPVICKCGPRKTRLNNTLDVFLISLCFGVCRSC